MVIRDQAGTREITVPPDFQLTVDGKPVTVALAKARMTGTATITTTTTVKPVTVTEVKNAEVMQASGYSLLVRTPTGFQAFSAGDIEKRGIKIVKDGQSVAFSDLRAGDRLTAMIITEKPARILTEQQVQATLATRPASTASAAPAPAATTGAPRMLPKTASSWPLVGLVSVLLLAMALALTVRRRLLRYRHSHQDEFPAGTILKVNRNRFSGSYSS